MTGVIRWMRANITLPWTCSTISAFPYHSFNPDVLQTWCYSYSKSHHRYGSDTSSCSDPARKLRLDRAKVPCEVLAVIMDQWLSTSTGRAPDHAMTSSSGQLTPQDSVSSVQPLTELSPDAESRKNLRLPLLSTRRTSAVWKYSRQPNSTEPRSTKHHQRIWYCKTQDCCYHTHNLGNAESHLRVKHHMILEATNSPRSQNIRSLIDQQQKRKADDSLNDERFGNQLRSIVDSAVVRKALAELVARRNLPYSCVE
jgi:hypothetical protein